MIMKMWVNEGGREEEGAQRKREAEKKGREKRRGRQRRRERQREGGREEGQRERKGGFHSSLIHSLSLLEFPRFERMDGLTPAQQFSELDAKPYPTTIDSWDGCKQSSLELELSR